MKTQIFVHKGFLGIKSSLDAEGLLNDPTDGNQLGVVVDASCCEFQQAAIDRLKKVPKSHDCIGDVDVFQAEDKVVFAWMGGLLAVFKEDDDISGSSTYSPELLKPAEFETPQDFVEFIDSITV